MLFNYWITCLPRTIKFLKFIASLKLASLRNPALCGNRARYFKPRMSDYSWVLSPLAQCQSRWVFAHCICYNVFENTWTWSLHILAIRFSKICVIIVWLLCNVHEKKKHFDTWILIWKVYCVIRSLITWIWWIIMWSSLRTSIHGVPLYRVDICHNFQYHFHVMAMQLNWFLKRNATVGSVDSGGSVFDILYILDYCNIWNL